MDSISPILSNIMVWIIFVMIYNTCIGMFYALGRRLTANHKGRYAPVFLLTCLVGYGVSFVGFGQLMTSVYPVIGYLGMFMIVVMVAWWLKSRTRINNESKRRQRIYELEYKRQHPDENLTQKEEEELHARLQKSNIDRYALREVIDTEVNRDLEGTDGVDAPDLQSFKAQTLREDHRTGRSDGKYASRPVGDK